MKSYKYLFFDLDHTLWDYDTNAAETLHLLFDRYDLSSLGIADAEAFSKVFFHENEKLWAAMDAGTIDKFYLRNNRFRVVMESANADMQAVEEDMLVSINRDFLTECSQKTGVMEGTFELLDYCLGKFDMHIITNGFEEVQSIKMASAGLDKYFGKIITSEKSGHRKPKAGIYTYALKHTKAALEESLMIGDNLMTDIKGARDFGMDQVYFNPLKRQHSHQVTKEITELSELLNLLKKGSGVKNG